MVNINAISNTTKNIRFNNLAALVIKNENSTVKNTHNMITTNQTGQCFT